MTHASAIQTIRPLGVVEASEKRERAEMAACAECGTPLESFEIARQAEAKGTKFESLCNNCVYIALGLR